MRLYLVRHGKTERNSASGRDADRLLKPRGHRQSIWLGQTISAELSPGDPPRLLASPITRAWQTAGLMSESLGVAPEEEPLLATGRTAKDVLDVIARERNQHVLILVGHDPHFSEALQILGGDAPAACDGLRTGQCARFFTEDGALRLDALLRLDDSGG